MRLERQERGVVGLKSVQSTSRIIFVLAVGLCVSSYCSHDEIVEGTKHITWAENPEREESDGDRWEGRRTEIHEGGMPYGSSFAVVLGGRRNISGEDIPIISPMDENITTTSWVGMHDVRKLVQVQGEFWRNE